MLEYFTYKKIKKHKAAKQAKEEEEERKHAEARKSGSVEEKPPKQPPRPDTAGSSSAGPSSSRVAAAAAGQPVLNRDDESFLESLLSDEGPSPPLPDRVATPDLEWPSDDASSMNVGASKDDPKGKKPAIDAKPNRLSIIFNRIKKHGDTLSPTDATTAPKTEEEREAKDISRILDRLNLSAKNNKIINLSNNSESTDLLSRFTQIFKDLANGVPTAYDDLMKLISDRDGAISKGFDKLPSSLQKLVMQLPDKLTSTIAPEILAAAAKSQGLKFDAKAEGGLKEAGMKMFVPQNLMELLTKPGAVVGMLRAIVAALRARWPAFIGMNVIWSMALFLLMFVLWYCHKRGREERLLKEKGADGEVDVAGGSEMGERVEELPDDPQLPEPNPETTRVEDSSAGTSSDLARPLP